jgi:hypothetical protein
MCADIGERWSISAGYRTVEGGADVDEVYNFAWFHYAVASLSAVTSGRLAASPFRHTTRVFPIASGSDMIPRNPGVSRTPSSRPPHPIRRGSP